VRVYLDDKADIDNTMANLARLAQEQRKARACMTVNTNVMYDMSVTTPLRQSIIHQRSLSKMRSGPLTRKCVILGRDQRKTTCL